MTTQYPFRKIGETLPTADAVTAIALHEERVIELPHLYSWLKAGAPNAGVYADSSRRGNTWVQGTVGSQPDILSNWHSLGINAFSFPNNAAKFLTANFAVPPTDVSYVVLCDLDPATSTGDGVDHALIGSALSTASNRYLFGQASRHPEILAQGWFTNLTFGSASAANTPLIYSFSMSSSTQKLSIRVNGGAWTDSGTWNGDSLADVTAQLGAYRVPQGSPWYGGVAEVLQFNCNLRATRSLYELQTTEQMLAAKAGITLG